MSDYDQLTDDEYDPDMDEPSKGGFRIRDPLQPPRAHPFSTADLHALIHQGLIDLNPPYQRDVVWPEVKQIGLIDSIFRNFYIPPVIFAVEKDEDGEELRVCVDGKQRLTSISKFMDDRDPVSKKKYWYTGSDAHSKSRLELPEPYKKQFQRKQITCVEYTGLIPGTERDIFQRVQLGMSLTAAEKLQAISSPLAGWVSQLQAMYVNSDGGLTDHIKWDTSRGRDFQGVAQLCYCCWHLPHYSMPSVPKVEKWLTTAEKPSNQFKAQVADVLQSFLHLATERQYQQAFIQVDKRVAPVEFVFIGVLLAKMRNCTWDDRAEEVLALRKHTRDEHKDVRTNERVMKTMWSFVEKVRTEAPDPYEGWEAPGAEDDDPPQKKKAPKATKAPTKKRKRKDDDDSDAKFRPTARAPKPRPKPESNGAHVLEVLYYARRVPCTTSTNQDPVTWEPVAFRGVPSLGAEKKMALSMTLTQKQVEAIFARQSALRELGSTSYPLEIDFNEHKIYIGNMATNFTSFKEDGIREICQRSPTVSKPLAPISLSGNVIGKLSIHRDFDQDVADNVRKATEAEHSKRNERTIVVLDSPPVISKTKKGRSGASASTLAKKAMSNRLVSAQAASARPPNSSTVSKASTPAGTTPSVSRPKPPTSNSKPTPPSSRSVSASARPSTPTSSITPSSSATTKEPDLTSLRARLTHFIALDPRTTQQVLLEIGGRSPSPETVCEIEDTLTAVAQEIQPPKKGPPGPVKWELRWRSWEKVRPYEWPDLTPDQRTRMARKGRLAFGQMDLPSTDPLWEHFKTRVLDTNALPSTGKGKGKTASGQTLMSSDFRGGMFPKEKKPTTKGGGVASGGITKTKTSTAKSKAKKDQEDEVETKVRKVLTADAKDKGNGSPAPSTTSSVPTARIPKKKKQEEVLPSSSKSRMPLGSTKREPSPLSKSARAQDEGAYKRKLPEFDADGTSEMEEGEVVVEPSVKKRKISSLGESSKSQATDNQTRNGDSLKKSIREKSKVEKNKLSVKEESVPPRAVNDTTSRVSVGASSSRAIGGKTQRLEKEQSRDPERSKAREPESRRASGKRGRRATPSFSSDEEEEEEPMKPSIAAHAPAPAASKPKLPPQPPSSKHVLPPKVTSRGPAPLSALPSDKEALRRRYHTCYARYMGVTSKFYEQRAKVEALLATGVENVSADDDVEMMDTEELMQLRGEHERLRDELQRIMHAHSTAMVF
ncbi:hypothetical protein JB92DRAFT_3096266 [Gautieria morchelliformis]|nr:hypothetical protein JB92DRAFT_3096266 [Gautieria morchelliformis]